MLYNFVLYILFKGIKKRINARIISKKIILKRFSACFSSFR
ncbi:hypothetical protein HMPREF1870_01678 [Bacteroidales bacterium KA00344]|nr:hypothetical protein HMPREF1870_01678 [Bacteroidales bacterium KA00344]